jgi:hypothetical protein
LAVADNPQTSRLAEQNSFQPAEVRMTFERSLPGDEATYAASNARVRLARKDDLPALRAIVAVSHHDTRFYFDERPVRTNALVATLTARSRADRR